MTQTKKNRSIADYFALAVSTCGVGYLPIAPGTWGSLVGVGIYLLYAKAANYSKLFLLDSGWVYQQYTAILYAKTGILLAAVCLLGIWASKRAVALFGSKDPQKIVVDEVMGQLIVFAFVPFQISVWLVAAGFVLFRVFDIWKPYPVRNVEGLPDGIGVCADDIVAGIYGGICLSVLYAVSLAV
ncbi:MAG: phosphatidylglycerophosphatase A [Pyrinomonadaceae bacterium]